MSRRVGITTDEERRRAEWKKEVVGLHNWQVHARGLSREDAQALEKEIAEANGCKYHAGGRELMIRMCNMVSV